MLLSVIFITPLVGVSIWHGFEHNKVIFFVIGVVASAICWAFLDYKNLLKKNYHFSNLQLASLIFLVSLLPGVIFGIDLKSSFFGKDPYYQGWALYVCLFLFSFLIANSAIAIKNFGWVVIASSLVVSIVAISQFVMLHFFNINVPTYAGRVISTFGQPNFFAGFILLSLPFFYMDKFKKPLHEDLFLIPSLLLMALAIAASGSRIAIFLLILFLLYFLIKKLKFSNRIFFALILFSLILSATASFYFKSGIFWREIIRPLTAQNYDSYIDAAEKRFYIWPVISVQILQKPLFGYGLENMDKAFSAYVPPQKDPGIALAVKDLIMARSHNIILDLLIFSGLVGFLGWLGLIAILFKTLRNKVMVEILVFYLVWSLFQNQSVVHLMFFWLVAGLDKE